jgi:hypothetical protein
MKGKNDSKAIIRPTCCRSASQMVQRVKYFAMALVFHLAQVYDSGNFT